MISEFCKWLFIIIPLTASPKDLRALAFSLENGFIPGCYVVGALVCVLQRYGLDAQDFALGSRRRKLLIFSVGLLAIAALFPIEHLLNTGLLRAFVWRMSHLGVVAVMGHSAIREYREQKRLFKKSPISKFHRSLDLVKEISGALLSLDLKNSEELFSLGKLENEPGKFVSICISRIWAIVDAAGGTVLVTDGDAIKAFFPDGTSAHSALKAILMSEKISSELDQIADQLKSIHGSLSKDWQIQFRAGLATGKIRPVWQEVGRDRFPNWIESGDTQPFLISTRLMDLERKLEPHSGSVVLVPSGLAQEIEETGGLARPFASRDLTIAGKHGVAYQLSVFVAGKSARPVDLDILKSAG